MWRLFKNTFHIEHLIVTISIEMNESLVFSFPNTIGRVLTATMKRYRECATSTKQVVMTVTIQGRRKTRWSWKTIGHKCTEINGEREERRPTPRGSFNGRFLSLISFHPFSSSSTFPPLFRVLQKASTRCTSAKVKRGDTFQVESTPRVKS